MSASPDQESFQAIATELGVDPSFIEKDWHAVRLVAVLAGIDRGELHPVFSGGTSLSKAYGLIQRFSEDLDFKYVLPDGDINRRTRREYREQVIGTIRAVEGWDIIGNIQSRNESRFFSCMISYPAAVGFAPALRPHIKLDISLVRPTLPPEKRPVQSFIAAARRDAPEVPSILCVAPAETAADKFSSLSRNVLTRQRNAADDDPTFIRHLHDLAALEAHATDHPDFPGLLREILLDEAGRGGAPPEIIALNPVERLAATLEALANDTDYPKEYERFVTAMSYAGEGETATFASALRAAHRLTGLIDEG